MARGLTPSWMIFPHCEWFSVALTASTNDSPVHVLMLSCQQQHLEFYKLLNNLCRNRHLVDTAIEHVLKQRKTDAVSITGGLTSVDVFYREVSNTTDKIFLCFDHSLSLALLFFLCYFYGYFYCLSLLLILHS